MSIKQQSMNASDIIRNKLIEAGGTATIQMLQGNVFCIKIPVTIELSKHRSYLELIMALMYLMSLLICFVNKMVRPLKVMAEAKITNWASQVASWVPSLVQLPIATQEES